MAGTDPKSSFAEIIQSKLFTFYIGKERKEFMVHSSAVAATSPQLKALISNGMSETQSASGNWDDIEPADFVRFVEYAYRCDYTVPPCTLYEDKSQDVVEATVEEPPAAEPEPEPEPEPAVEFDTWGVPRPSKKKVNKKLAASRVADDLRKKFEEREYLKTSEPKTTMLEAFEPEKSTAPNEDFTPVLLAHARLYTFACMRLIDPLRRLTLHKLHKTLQEFILYHARIGDVIELARYAYDNGEDRRQDGTVDDLRQLVVEYIACHVDVFGGDSRLEMMLQEGGEFVVDFWRIVFKEKPF